MNQEWIGWICSVVLIVTVLTQVVKEWNTPKPKGVSQWLYIGQLVAEFGFIIYSYLVSNWVFVVTNALMFAINLVGICVHVSRKSSSSAVSAL